MADVLIALGSNVGDRAGALGAAILQLVETPGIDLLRRSSLYETCPVGGPGRQGAFINAAVTMRTSLAPLDLLDRMQAIEGGLGRARGERWGARTVDLDLLLCGAQTLDTKRLRVPHPRISFRPFVLEPAMEIAGEWVHPELESTLAELLDTLRSGAEEVRIAGEADLRVMVAGEIITSLPRFQAASNAVEGETWLRLQGAVAQPSRPKLQVLIDEAATALPGTPCLRLQEMPRRDWPAELAAAVECVWPDFLGEPRVE